MLKKLSRGVVLLDKPRGLTSRECVDKVKEALKVGKAGHTGTLDTNATGLLVVALEEAGKAMPLLMGLVKEYLAVVRLHQDAGEDEIKKACGSFVGRVVQKPPVRSAVARKPREREVLSIGVVKIQGRDVHLKVLCEAGFYVRLLAHEIGEKLGTGAHLARLRRTRVGPLSVGKAVSMERLKPGSALALEKVLDEIGIKKITVKKAALAHVRNGAPVRREWVAKADKLTPGENVGIFHGSRIVALGVASREGKTVARTDRVFLES